ncbi:hypothetical protein ABZX62_20320 [Streptomyces flavidovirens]|uniref:hypothetical protein n=1 Tax=Streptomyces flavidovirens TaxID=67298 RepID=UPI0033B22B79
MDPNVASGLIGFGGAVVGAGAALLGGLLQHRYQAKTTAAERTQEYGRAAGEKALTELYALRRHMIECGMADIPEARQPWQYIAKTHMDEAELAVMLMPKAQKVQDRISEVMGAGSQQMTTSGGDRVRQTTVGRGMALEAIDILSAYMRGDALPKPSPRVERYRETTAHSE